MIGFARFIAVRTFPTFFALFIFFAPVPQFAQNASPPSAAQQQYPDAIRSELNLGVDAFKNARYEDAISHFRRAVELDPSHPVARLYLGTALAQNVVPGLLTPENLKVADEALGIFTALAAENPRDVASLKQAGAVCFSIRRLDEAKSWQKRVLDANPSDAEAAYTIGVVDWTLAHQNLIGILQPLGLADDGEGNLAAPSEAMARLRDLNAPLLDEGTVYLNQALANRPRYADAMAYLNLVYRMKASVDRGDAATRTEDLRQAREWTQKAMEMRKANDALRNERLGGATVDTGGNLK